MFQIISNGGYNDVLIVTLAVSDSNNIETFSADNFVISTNMDWKDEIRGYLALLTSNKPTDKVLSVIPVWEDQPQNEKLYDYLIR